MDFKKIFEIVCRWYVFIFLNVYGFGKIAGGQFYRRGKLPPEVAELTLGQAGHFELAWTFMGYSYAYILFIGISQLTGAWFLLWEKTKLLGIAILFPILVNIIVFDIIFLDMYGALVSAMIYFSMLLYILFFNREKIIRAIQAVIAVEPTEKSGLPDMLKTAAAVLIAMVIVFAADQMLVHFFGHGKG